ncbi:unnamed protein product [Rhizophagus irregularis]|uniref:Crinkler family protein n=1 Tax=Rhizophagus irregularis TaxID=588596 RepID=A0A2N1MGA2_9GLOM|nr:hypothetical protein RhiirC2_718959 [Rhizophagus irregularis]CAB4385786.1 unnamed protein product [Rhizophagus irregularis]CAB5393448.1 unnamed protein product [Rhizophagus irregularis]
MSLNIANIVKSLSKEPDKLSENEVVDLYILLTGNKTMLTEVVTFCKHLQTNRAKLKYLRELLKKSKSKSGKRPASPSGEQREPKHRKFIESTFKNIFDLVKNIRNSSTPILDKQCFIKHPQDKILAVIEKPTMYVRESFVDLYHILTNKTSKGSGHKFIITGTAGIGKSCFLIYMLIRLLCEPKNVTVIFQAYQSEDFYYFRCFGDVVFKRGSYNDFSTYIDSPETWYLADDILSPELVQAKSVVALSPKGVVKDEFQAYDKEAVLSFNMPPWSLDELTLCRQHVYTDVSEEIMLALYEKAGGVPKYIFPRVDKLLQYLDPEAPKDVKKSKVVEHSLSRIERALLKTKEFDKLVSCISEKAYFIKFSSHLVHKWPNDYSYENYHLRWASHYVYKEIEGKLDNQSWKDLLEKMRTLKKYPSARGIMFEMYVIHLFKSSSNSFNMRELLEDQGSPQQKKFSIKKLSRIGNIRTADEISRYKNDGILIIPDISNFGAADLLYTPDMIFQVTVFKDHPIKQTELVKIVKNMPANEKNNPISLVFVVPGDIYNNFKYQDIVTKDPISKKFQKVKNLNPELKNMQQWVLKVDISKPPVFAKTGETLRSNSSMGQYNSSPGDNKNALHSFPHLTPSQPVPPQAEFKASDFKFKKSKISDSKSGSSSRSSSKVESNLLEASQNQDQEMFHY